MRILSLIAVGVLVSSLAAPARAGNILSGYTYVIDGDTIDVGGRRVRINGTCSGKSWA